MAQTKSAEDLLRRILGRMNDQDQREVLLDAFDKTEGDDVFSYADGIKDILRLLEDIVEPPGSRNSLYRLELILTNDQAYIPSRYVTKDRKVRVKIAGIGRIRYIDLETMRKLISKYAVYAELLPGKDERYNVVLSVDTPTLLINSEKLR